MSETKNAKITSTMLGREDHGIPTCLLWLVYSDGSCQSFGGYDLRHPNHQLFIFKVLTIVGVSFVEDVVGKVIRVKIPGVFGGPIEAIGHAIEDRWFNPEDSND